MVEESSFTIPPESSFQAVRLLITPRPPREAPVEAAGSAAQAVVPYLSTTSFTIILLPIEELDYILTQAARR